eukprot:Lithocolla_globosa_v1_NODE_918_length_3082_cov_45.234886.p3 type:complete len:131 gc:universal NODE_918_length_3082_cov_45.234886:1573-1965(+)
MRANTSAHSFKTRAGILTGPVACLTLIFLRYRRTVRERSFTLLMEWFVFLGTNGTLTPSSFTVAFSTKRAFNISAFSLADSAVISTPSGPVVSRTGIVVWEPFAVTRSMMLHHAFGSPLDSVISLFTSVR